MQANDHLLNSYWIIGDDDTHVWSTISNALVSLTDPAYVAWSNAGYPTMRLPTYSDLYNLLLNIAPQTAAGLAPSWFASDYLTPSQAFNYLESIGCHITSTGNPELNGYYAIDSVTQSKIQAIALYISIHNAFPAQLSQLPYPDISGEPHVFLSTESFMNFATALGDYVTLLNLESAQQNPSWPTQPSVIP